MESIIMLLVPIVVAGITQFIKRIQAIKYSDNRKSIIRIFAITTTFVGMVMASLANGDTVPTQDITVYAQTLVGWLAIQIPYWLAKAKK